MSGSTVFRHQEYYKIRYFTTSSTGLRIPTYLNSATLIAGADANWNPKVGPANHKVRANLLQ